MISLYRRHRAACKHTSRWTKCSCPIWAQAKLKGKQIQPSLETTGRIECCAEESVEIMRLLRKYFILDD